MAANSNFILLTSFLLFAFLSFPSIICEEEFDYEEGSSRGPEHWGQLNYPKWKTCGDGKMQSPIDIQRQNVTVFPKMKALTRKYKAAHAVLKNRGHDIMVEWTEDAGYISIGRTKYFLNQSHWHTPSEHHLDNRSYDMEMHMVHKSKDGKIAVIGILYRIGHRGDKFIRELMNKIFYLAVNRNRIKSVDLGLVDPKHAGIGRGGNYYRYNGSLTTPACDEGVLWTVMQDVHNVARYQIRALHMAVDPVNRSGSTADLQSFDASHVSPAAATKPKDLEFVSVPQHPGKSHKQGKSGDQQHPPESKDGKSDDHQHPPESKDGDQQHPPESDEEEFGYEEGSGKGPEKWGQLKPEWEACGKGKKQSPIDISNNHVTPSVEMGTLPKKYKPAHSILHSRGHDITIKWDGDAGGIRINGTEYHLKTCHWHSPSEHTINGTRFDLELHMVHESDKGEISVVAILYRYGQHDDFLAKFMHAITTVGTTDEVIGFTNPTDIKIGSRKYYRYEGSLTTPPCTEGVIWNVMKKVRTASKSQIFALRGAVKEGYENNSRPIQALNGRPIWLYSPPNTE
ncbi:alpha carbonic anhydrase 8-like [Nymphaea colorata]|nr:alpha carbonic anhydrase 8-like [Nymphaea colorata]